MKYSQTSVAKAAVQRLAYTLGKNLSGNRSWDFLILCFYGDLTFEKANLNSLKLSTLDQKLTSFFLNLVNFRTQNKSKSKWNSTAQITTVSSFLFVMVA